MRLRKQRRYLTAPDQCQHRAILRIVVRNGFTHDLASGGAAYVVDDIGRR
jgi:hypothetical protein